MARKTTNRPTNTPTKKTMTAYDRMVVLLARRDHSAQELTAKLRTAGHTPEEIEEALEFARTRNWLPDESVLATREAGRLARAGKSPQQIGAWLTKKGLPTKGLVIDESPEESAYKTATKTWSRLLRTAERDVAKAEKAKMAGKKRSSWAQAGAGTNLEEALKTRVLRLLISRGFSSTTARTVFTRLLSENPL